MNAFNRAQRLYDAQTPPDPIDPPSALMSEAEFSESLLAWFDALPGREQDDIIDRLDAWLIAKERP